MLGGLFERTDDSSHFYLKTRGDIAVVVVDQHEMRHPEHAAGFADDYRAMLEKRKPKAVVLDLAAVRYLSSNAFAVLFILAKEAQEAGMPFRLCGLHRDVEVGAKIIGLGRIVDIYANEHDALASLKQGA